MPPEKKLTLSNQEQSRTTLDAATTLAENITKTKTAFNVADASGLTEKTYVDLNGEEIFITKITGNIDLTSREVKMELPLLDSLSRRRNLYYQCC